MCTPAHALKSTSNQSFAYFFFILNTRFLLGLPQKHICNIIEEIFFRKCTFLLFSKTISSIMFQICFRAHHSQDRVFKISKIIQNFDYKYISGHILPCTQNCHLNSNSTHCGDGGWEDSNRQGGRQYLLKWNFMGIFIIFVFKKILI